MHSNDQRRLKDMTTGLYMISATCGLVDAVCFLALGGVFAQMMTGNLLFMAFSIGTGGLGGSVRHAPAILAFSAGALLGGRLLRGPAKWQERRIGFAVEWIIILVATLVAWFGNPDAQNLSGRAVIAMLSLAMGIQNAMVRVHGVPDIATNAMTVTFTGIIADSTFAGGDNKGWSRRILSIGLFCVSAAVGAWLLRFGTVWPLVLTSTIFSVAMIPLLLGEKAKSG